MGGVQLFLLRSFHSALGGGAQSCYKFRHGRGCLGLLFIPPWAVVHEIVDNSAMGGGAQSCYYFPHVRRRMGASAVLPPVGGTFFITDSFFFSQHFHFWGTLFLVISLQIISEAFLALRCSP